MNPKALIAIAVVVLLSIIGFNYYSGAQTEKKIAEMQASTAAMAAQTQAAKQSVSKPVAVASAVPAANQAQSGPVEEVMVASDNELLKPVVPEEVKPKAKPDDSVCEVMIGLGESVMRARQNGASIEDALNVTKSLKDGTAANEAMGVISKQMVIDAYKHPAFSTDDYKEKAIREFGSKQYLTCVDAINRP